MRTVCAPATTGGSNKIATTYKDGLLAWVSIGAATNGIGEARPTVRECLDARGMHVSRGFNNRLFSRYRSL